MNLFLCTSKYLYDKVPAIKKELEARGHVITVPNCFDDPMKEEEMKKLGADAHREWKAGMIRLQREKILANDGILVLNFEKNGQPNYIGGATFLEIYQAFDNNRKIFLYNPLPQNTFTDELKAMGPIVIDGNLDLIH
ncbi:hypothetical protein IPH19_04020 [Candidatus Uhrbacteria bacterium]|jgi:hypothetical protein|nr:MAG: hypothetical protein IPH19_04020 [Candidatus Uhrbacteria bacterium]